MAPDALRRLEAHALFAKALGGSDDLPRDNPVLQDLLVVVEVVEEEVEGENALLETLLEAVPLATRDDARDEVEGKGLFDAAIVAVDVERNTGLHQRSLGCLLPQF